MDVFIILQLSANNFRENKGRKTTTLQETQAQHIF